MDAELVLLVIVVATALAFDFTNGFHDTANVVATSISTRAMAPKIAVGYAAVLNFVGAFLSIQVAATIASGIVDADLVTEQIVFGGLIGAIAWNLITWYYGLPSSSSHALIGGVVGSMLVAEGPDADHRRGPAGQGGRPRRGRPDPGVRRGRRGDHPGLPDRGQPQTRPAPTPASRVARSSPAACWPWPTAPTTRRRPWASSPSR